MINNLNENKRMKRILLCAFLIAFSAILIPVTFAYASEKSDRENMKMVMKYYKAQKYKKAEKYNKKLPTYANEKCVKNMSVDMKKAYKKTVKSNKKNLWDYYYTDFDNDGKADLILHMGTCEADATFKVFRFWNGEAKYLGSIPAGHSMIHAYPKHNGVLTALGHMGYEAIDYYYLKNGKIQHKKLGSREHEPYFTPGCALKGLLHSD